MGVSLVVRCTEHVDEQRNGHELENSFWRNNPVVRSTSSANYLLNAKHPDVSLMTIQTYKRQLNTTDLL